MYYTIPNLGKRETYYTHIAEARRDAVIYLRQIPESKMRIDIYEYRRGYQGSVSRIFCKRTKGCIGYRTKDGIEHILKLDGTFREE